MPSRFISAYAACRLCIVSTNPVQPKYLALFMLSATGRPQAAASPNGKCAPTSANGSCVSPCCAMSERHAVALAGSDAQEVRVKEKPDCDGGP